MRKIMEDLVDKDKKESAMRLLKMGKLSNEEIAFGVGLPVEIINMLQKEEGAIV